MQEQSKPYNPKEVEEKWLKTWLEKKLFKSNPESDKEHFSIALPPPNVTGSLHMGHAFGDTIQDVLIRYHRMNGKNVLWQGGTDHAGIGTQIVVEKEISKTEKKKRYDLGREEFLKRVWDWKKKSGDQIINQMQKLGCAMDYDRTVFTMDENYKKAVKKVFIELYDKGLIYKGKRIVNWCPKCLTSISDLEVETEPSSGKLYHILYPFDINDIPRGGLIVATSRPETMFGDVAVCINPNDGRYKKLIGESVYIPLINKNIPIISDEAVELDFGTGCLKITPSHDANDYEIFNRNIEIFQDKKYIEIMSPKGTIQDKDNLRIPEDILGQERFKAREITIKKLEELGFLKEIKEYNQPSSKHDRCNTVIEPLLSDQWYVKMKPLAEPAIKVVEEEKTIKFIPERYSEQYLNWLKNIKDWCISRQLWWGHQIPVWYKKGEDRSIEKNRHVKEDPPDDIENYEQDEDVLDTWFSSALWPFVTLGWPDESQHLSAFYPTSVLATAREIINLWVSRMIFMSLRFPKKIPFSTVLIHPVIQTPDGKRMSKSKGNAIDPLEMIDKYGADANRFWYFSLGVTGNQDVRFPGSKDKDGKWESATLEQYKRFSNKIWNASKFVIQNLDKKTYEITYLERLIQQRLIIDKDLTPADKWILYELNRLIESVERNFKEYNFHAITKDLYEFTWDKFCDWYIEIAKMQLAKDNLQSHTKEILFYVLNNLLRLLHPIMPFITDEIWSTLPIETEQKGKCLLELELFPAQSYDSLHWSDADEFNYIIELTREIRNIRQTSNLSWSETIDIYVFSELPYAIELLKKLSPYIEELVKGKVIILDKYNPIKPSVGSWVSEGLILKILSSRNENVRNTTGTKFFIPIKDIEKVQKLFDQYSKKKTHLEKDLLVCTTKLNNPSFINNAHKEKVDEVKNQVKELENHINSINEQIELLK